MAAVESTTATTVNGVNPSFNMPATRPDDDLYLVHVVSDDEVASTAPAGWTQITGRTDDLGNTAYQLVAWRLGSSEPASYQLGGSCDGGVAVVTRMSGVDTTTPIDNSGDDAATGTTATAPAVTVTQSGTEVLRLFLSDGAAVSNLPGTAGYNETGTSSVHAAMGHAAGPASGSTGTATADLAASDQWIATTVAVAPDAGGAVTVTPPDSQHGHTSDTVTVDVAYSVTPDDSQHGHTSATVAVSTAATVAVADSQHAHTSDTVTVGVAYTVAPGDSQHGHTSETVQVSVAGQVSPADSQHSHTSEVVAVSVDYTVTPQDSRHGHTSQLVIVSDPSVPDVDITVTVGPTRIANVTVAATRVANVAVAGTRVANVEVDDTRTANVTVDDTRS